MGKIKAVIFDVDGTLLNPEEGVCRAVNYVIEQFQLPAISHEDLLAFNGPPIHASFKKHYDLKEAKIAELVEAFRNRYKEHDLLFAKTYEGIYDTFSSLAERGFKLGIATYKRQDYALELLKHFHFDHYTSIIYGSDYFNKLKKKDIVEKCLTQLEIETPSEAVMVGDSDNDAVAAMEIGMQFLGVTYGFGFKNKKDMKKYCPIGCATSPVDIYSILASLDR